MSERFNLLIVDDNRALAANLSDIMNKHNYNTVVAFNGESAVKIISDNDFDFGLIDLKLPDITGINLIKKIIEQKPSMEFIIITAHGSYENAVEAVSLKNILGFEKKPIDIDRLLSIIDQISRRRKLEISLRESEERYKNLIDNSLTGINISKDNKIIFHNSTMIDIFGYKKGEDMTGMDISDLIHPDDLDMVMEKVRSRLNGETEEVRYECRGIRKDGSVINIEVLGTIIKHEGELAIQGTILDVSKRMEAEAELTKYRKNLEDKILERTEELAKKNEELQNFNKLFIGREKRIKELKDKLKQDEGDDV
ncbi:MAG: PAS domain S-box protein [Candidatus Aminicenantes bacterium]|nr:PAS domain S-box protein [Candidatus Aminicenantes bacterium]